MIMILFTLHTLIYSTIFELWNNYIISQCDWSSLWASNAKLVASFVTAAVVCLASGVWIIFLLWVFSVRAPGGTW